MTLTVLPIAAPVADDVFPVADSGGQESFAHELDRAVSRSEGSRRDDSDPVSDSPKSDAQAARGRSRHDDGVGESSVSPSDSAEAHDGEEIASNRAIEGENSPELGVADIAVVGEVSIETAAAAVDVAAPAETSVEVIAIEADSEAPQPIEVNTKVQIATPESLVVGLMGTGSEVSAVSVDPGLPGVFDAASPSVASPSVASPSGASVSVASPSGAGATEVVPGEALIAGSAMSAVAVRSAPATVANETPVAEPAVVADELLETLGETSGPTTPIGSHAESSADQVPGAEVIELDVGDATADAGDFSGETSGDEGPDLGARQAPVSSAGNPGSSNAGSTQPAIASAETTVQAPVQAQGSPTAAGRVDGGAMRASIERVMATLETMAKQPPPRTLTLDLTDLHGVRVTLALGEGSVSVSVANSGAGETGAEQWQEQLNQLLDERDFRRDAREQNPDDSDQNVRPTRAGASMAPKPSNELRL